VSPNFGINHLACMEGTEIASLFCTKHTTEISLMKNLSALESVIIVRLV
jgi:hypothetical protein